MIPLLEIEAIAMKPFGQSSTQVSFRNHFIYFDRVIKSVIMLERLFLLHYDLMKERREKSWFLVLFTYKAVREINGKIRKIPD